VAAFAAGIVPPSLLLASKEGEVAAAKEEARVANEKLRQMNDGLNALISTLELEVDTADAELDEVLAAGTRAAKKRRDDLRELREKYESQVKQLKELVGDQNDRLELQQNSYSRLSSIAESARMESLALKERARLLEERLEAAKQQLAKVEAEALASPFAGFMKMFR